MLEVTTKGEVVEETPGVFFLVRREAPSFRWRSLVLGVGGT